MNTTRFEKKIQTSDEKISSPRHILWAVDVFAENAETAHRSEIELLRVLAKDSDVSIEPIYVLSPDGLNFPFPLGNEWVPKFKPAAENAFHSLLQGVEIRGLRRPTVLIQKNLSATLTIHKLLSYADATNTDLIVLSSHGRKGLPRLLLGSFAENLILQSRVPLLITHPETHAAPLKRLLFPTDLHPRALGTFHQTVAFAKDRGVEMVLLHAMTDPVESVIQSGVYLLSGGWVSFESFRAKEAAEKEAIARKWCGLAGGEGVRCEPLLFFAKEPISTTILEQAHSLDCQLIAMAAHSGPFAAALVGSIARQVIRQADLPVWIVHMQD